MIDEITASVTDPNRNPNVGAAGQANGDDDRDQGNRNDNARERDDERDSATENRRRSARERSNDRNRRTPTNSRASDSTRETVPGIQGGTGPGGNQNNDDCESPFENLPEDMRPEGFPFDDC
jgi:hypothetical protein